MNQTNEYAWNTEVEEDTRVKLDEPGVCSYCSAKGITHLGLCFECFEWISLDEMAMWYTVYTGKEYVFDAMQD